MKEIGSLRNNDPRRSGGTVLCWQALQELYDLFNWTGPSDIPYFLRICRFAR